MSCGRRPSPPAPSPTREGELSPDATAVSQGFWQLAKRSPYAGFSRLRLSPFCGKCERIYESFCDLFVTFLSQLAYTSQQGGRDTYGHPWNHRQT